jgi:4-carboxymuconolactone decarboxylase
MESQSSSNRMTKRPPITPEDVLHVSPALQHDTEGRLAEVWNRPGLSRRDRGLITVASLVARNLTTSFPYYFNVALNSGLTPAELSELIHHLAYYSGFGNAYAAVHAARDLFAERGIHSDQLPKATPDAAERLPIDEAAESKRATTVQGNLGTTAPGVVEYTTSALFRDLWLRPGLAARDRSLVTVSALVAGGQVAQITFHLNRAMDNGLTREQASEVFTHLAFYAGWPNVMSALPVAKDVFEKRG